MLSFNKKPKQKKMSENFSRQLYLNGNLMINVISLFHKTLHYDFLA